jgi:hypothetical protein
VSAAFKGGRGGYEQVGFNKERGSGNVDDGDDALESMLAETYK